MKILLGADGSDFARIAEELIVRVPSWQSAEVVCASVAPSLALLFTPDPFLGAATAEVAGDTYDSAKRLAKDYADAAASRLGARGLKATTANLEGEPGHELLEFAERNEIDLVAVGSRGMSPVESLLLGSVARKMVAHARCHVLVGRALEGKSPEASLKAVKSDAKLTVAVGVDGTDGAQIVLDFVKAQGSSAFDKVVVVCAEPLSAVPAGIDPAVFTDLYKYDHERAAAIAKRAETDLKGSAPQVASETELGRPAFAIGKVAKRHSAELIVISATRHDTLERFLIGSASYELATEAPCSVLVVRPKS